MGCQRLQHDQTVLGCLASRRNRNPGVERDESSFMLNGKGEQVYVRSEEHTSELQSPCNLVCRLLLEKKKKITTLHVFHQYIDHDVSLLSGSSIRVCRD